MLNFSISGRLKIIQYTHILSTLREIRSDENDVSNLRVNVKL
jgi:hypothetical protein